MLLRLRRSLYLQVLVAAALGVVVGVVRPAWGPNLRVLGDGFIKLITMLIGPIIFTTVVTGIARMGDLRKIGRLGWKTIVYFELVTTLALAIGLCVGHLVKPGAGMHAIHLDAGAVQTYVKGAEQLTLKDHLLGIIPRTVFGAFTDGNVLQVLFVALLFGAAVTALGERTAPLVTLVDQLGHVLFKIVSYVMHVAPLGAFGAMAFTVGSYGLGTLGSLGKLIACFYLTAALFVVIVLGAIARLVGFSIFAYLRYIADELLLVLGTSSSETALPRLMQKLERAGCAPGVVGVVVPLGYSFNLDGTSIYLTLATLFIAQATDTTLSFGQELTLLAVLLLTSKGSAAVTGGGFVTLAATLSSTRAVPVAGLSLIVGIDRFMSEVRALTNLIGNGVATFVVARWEGDLDRERLREALTPPRARRPNEPRPRS
jgi:aerobic C4-dicarboxylate transport protein